MQLFTSTALAAKVESFSSLQHWSHNGQGRFIVDVREPIERVIQIGRTSLKRQT
jgi:hypothetical protein